MMQQLLLLGMNQSFCVFGISDWSHEQFIAWGGPKIQQNHLAP
jgi:hypothetical protein